MADDRSSDEKWVRIHPDDRLWLEEEVLRLLRERYKETADLNRPSIQDTLSSLFDELRASREELADLRERADWLESRLARCRCESEASTITRDAPHRHPPGLPPEHTRRPSRGRTGARLV